MSFERGFEPPFPDPKDILGNYYDEENPFDPDEPDNYDPDEVYTDGPLYETIDGVQLPIPYDENATLTASETETTDDPDDNPYGMVYDQRGRRIPTTHEVLSDAAYDIDDTESWQVLRIRGSLDNDIFYVNVLSKAAVPEVVMEDFGDIAGCIVIDAEPGDDDKKVQGIAFDGTRDQMDDFIRYLRDKMVFPVDGEENPLDKLRIPLPWITFWALAERVTANEDR